MQNKKNIDELFESKFENFEVTPPPEVWGRISDTLNGKKRRAAIIWFRRAGVAAAVIIAFVSGWFINQQVNDNVNLARLDVIDDYSNRYPSNYQLYSPENRSTFNIKKSKIQQFKPISRNEGLKYLYQDRVAEEIEKMKSVGILLDENPLKFKLVAMNSDGLSAKDREIIAHNLQYENKEEKKEVIDRWSMGVMASPDFNFNGASSKNDLTNEAAIYNASANNELYDVTVSSGINVEYAATKRLKIRSGVRYAQLRQSSENIGLKYSAIFMSENAKYAFGDFAIPMTSNNIANKSQNIGLMSNMGVVKLSNLPAGTEIATAGNPRTQANQFVENYSLLQQAGYVELPLVLKYELLQGNFSIDVLGGVNTNVLVNNGVRLSNSEGSLDAGSINDLKYLSWSSLVGVGLNYSIFENLMFTMEPSLKYRLSSISSSKIVSQQPFTFGIYTGFTYNF